MDENDCFFLLTNNLYSGNFDEGDPNYRMIEPLVGIVSTAASSGCITKFDEDYKNS
jgi:hypothetical protein